MKVNVKLLPRGEKLEAFELKKDATGQALLEKLNLAFDAHIITREGNPIPLDEKLRDGENIGIITVVSGG